MVFPQVSSWKLQLPPTRSSGPRVEMGKENGTAVDSTKKDIEHRKTVTRAINERG